MRRWLSLLLCIVFFCLIPITASAHPGGTDSSGGHWNHSTGKYHYHHGRSAHDHYDMDGDGTADCPFTFKGNEYSNDYSSINETKEIANNHEEQDMSYINVIVYFLFLCFIVPFSFFALGFLPYVVTVFLYFPVEFILRPFTKDLNDKEKESFVYKAAVSLCFIIILICALPSVTEYLLNDADMIAAVVAYLAIVVFFAIMYIRNLQKENDGLLTKLNNYQRKEIK